VCRAVLRATRVLQQCTHSIVKSAIFTHHHDAAEPLIDTERDMYPLLVMQYHDIRMSLDMCVQFVLLPLALELHESHCSSMHTVVKVYTSVLLYNEGSSIKRCAIV
jgi:hypothetical protein